MFDMPLNTIECQLKKFTFAFYPFTSTENGTGTGTGIANANTLLFQSVTGEAAAQGSRPQQLS